MKHVVVLRWFVPVAVALLALSAYGPSASAASNASIRSLSSLDALALAGISGTFDEVYQVVGPPGGGTVEVAQKADPGRRPFVTGSGEWSFVYQTRAFSSQWIEKGSMSWNCWHWADVATWTCSGPGHFEDANGFLLGIEPYIPGVVLDEVEEFQLELDTKHSPVESTSVFVFGSNSASFGPLRCMRVAATALEPLSSCFDQHGTLVTQKGGSYWTTITLARYRSTVPRSAFQLKGTSTSSGRNFGVSPG